MSTNHVRVKGLPECTARSGVSSNLNAHVVIFHARGCPLSRCRFVTKIKVQLVVLRADTVRRSKVEPIASVVEVKLEIRIAQCDVGFPGNVLPAGLDVPTFKVCGIPVAV